MATLTFSSTAQGYDLTQGASLTTSSATSFTVENVSTRIVFSGTSLTYDLTTGLPTGGTVTGFTVYRFDNAGTGTPTSFGTATGLSSSLNAYSLYSGFSGFITSLLSGNDTINGSTGNDSLNGYSGNDSITGGNGDDTLAGGSGSDTLVGGAGNDLYILDDANDTITEAASAGTDTIRIMQGGTYTLATNVENAEIGNTYSYGVTINGNGSHNLISGGSYNDSITGGAGNDRLSGLAGNDTLNGGTGNDTMFGGAGADTYYVDATTDRIFEETTGSTTYETGDWVVSTVTYTLGNYLEHLRLNPGTSAINGTGNSLNNILVANNGNNVLNGAAGNDTVSFETATTKVTSTLTSATGGSGTDTLSGIENLLGGTAGDDLTGNTAANVIDGNTGNDTMKGGDGNDTYYVDVLGDVVSESSLAGGGADMVYSRVDYTLGNYVENLSLDANYSYIFYNYSYTASAVNGTGNSLANQITGNWNANNLLGMAGNDTINGGAGNDTINGGTGADSMTGGAGADSYYVDNIGDVVAGEQPPYYGAAEIDTVLSTISFALSANLENLTLLGTGNINGGGNDADNLIIANTGSNYMDGGMGIDTLSYGTHSAAVNVSLALTGTQVTGGSGSDRIANFENLTGGSGNDTLGGSATANVIDGGLGNDSMSGGAGDDTYIVNAPTDIIVEGSNAGNDTVRASGVAGNTFTLAANVENIIISAGYDAINATGNTLANVIVGNQGANSLSGGDGNDTIDGGLGTDAMTGGLGNDVFYVDAATDVVTEAASAGTDKVIVGYSPSYGNSAYAPAAMAYTLANNVENLHLTSKGSAYGYSSYDRIDLTGTGNSLNNLITAGDGFDVLNGAAGNDTLSGGAGNDTLIGGAGNDVFLFDTALSVPNPLSIYYPPLALGPDTITDFTAGTDKIHLSDDVFTALNAPGTLGASSLLVGTGDVATAAAQRLIYNTTTGALYYDADGSGAQHGAIQIAIVGTSTHPTLAATDFVVV